MTRRRRRRKRLNKTVAIFGSAVVALLILVTLVTLSFRGRDPEAYRLDAERAMVAQDYEAAVLNYRQALGATKTKVGKVALLFNLAQAYVYTDQWPKVMACWNRVVVEEPSNIKARLALLEAQYVQADSQTRSGWQVGAVWKAVEKEASELMDIVERALALDQSRQQWLALDIDWQPEAGLQDVSLRLYLHLLRGRAAYEQAHLGAVTDPQQALEQARTDLEAVLQLDATLVDAYWYLAKVITEGGEAKHARGDNQARAQAAREADALLAQAVDKAPESAQAQTYLLEAHLERVRTQVTLVVERRQKLAALERDYRKLTETFPKAPVVFTSQARFYWMQAFYATPQERQAKVTQSINAAQRATELGPKRVDLRLALGELYFRQAMMTQNPDPLDQAIATGQRALRSPEAQATSGPRTFANKANRLSIQAFLAHCNIEAILMFPEEEPSPAKLKSARAAVRQVEQLLGSTEDPEVAKWQGMLALAQGQTHQAVRELYGVYEKSKASHQYGRSDPVVSYALARLCLHRAELGKALEFLSASLKSGLGYIRPAVILDYLELLGRLDMWTHVLVSSNAYNVDAYEDFFGADARSRALRIRALIRSQRWQEAKNQLTQLSSDHKEKESLHIELLLGRLGKAQRVAAQSNLAVTPASGESSSAQMRSLRDELTNRLRQQVERDVENVSPEAVAATLGSLIEGGDIQSAQTLVSLTRTLGARHATIGFYERLLAEKHPDQVKPERRFALHVQALEALSDPIQRGLELGRAYQQQSQLDRALASLKPVLERAVAPREVRSRSRRQRLLQASLRQAADLAMAISLEQQNWSLAEQITRQVRKANLDGCQGSLFEAQMSLARHRYGEALKQVEKTLVLCPLSSHAYLVRSQIHMAQEQTEAALADITEAATLNPTNTLMAKMHVQALLKRDLDLGDRVTDVQKDETRRALERALHLSPTDPDLLGLYAQRSAGEDPSKAVAIYQALAERYPTLDTLLTLGDLATHAAGQTEASRRRDIYYKMAGAAYEKASTLDPHDPRLLQSYTRYYRLTGQEQKAEALLSQGQDAQLLWSHLLAQGEVDKAHQVLEQAYRKNPKNEAVLRGLLTVAQQQHQEAQMKQYAQALVEAADTLPNRIEQITLLLRLGLVQEAQTKLERARERFPQEPKVILLEGWVALRLGRLDEALTKINQGLETEKESAVAWYLRGQVYLLQGQADKAIADLRRSKVLADTPTTRLTLAKAFLQAHRQTEAMVELKQAVTEKQAPTQARQLLERLYIETGKTHELGTFYEQMQRLFPEDVTWLNQAGAFHLRQRRPAEAADLYAQSCARKREELSAASHEQWRSDRDFVAACHGLFQALLAQAERQPTTTRVQTFARIHEEVGLYRGTPYEAMAQLYWMQAQVAQGRRAEAVNQCQQILALGVTSGDMGPLIRRMAEILGTPEVERLCEAMIRISAQREAGYLGTFYLAGQSGQYEKALEAMDACLARVPPGQERRWSYRLERAKLLTVAYEKTAGTHYRDLAVSAYQSLVQKWPTNSNVLNNLAYLLAETQDGLTEALAYAQKAWAAAPDHPVVLDTYGTVLLKNGQYEQAVELLSAALQQYEQRQVQVPPQVFEHLGLAWEALGDKEKARRAFEQALHAEPQALTSKAQTRLQSAIGRLSP